VRENSPAQTSTLSSKHFVHFAGFGGSFAMSRRTRRDSIPLLRMLRPLLTAQSRYKMNATRPRPTPTYSSLGVTALHLRSLSDSNDLKKRPFSESTRDVGDSQFEMPIVIVTIPGVESAFDYRANNSHLFPMYDLAATIESQAYESTRRKRRRGKH
jgi:hypothetical protein